MSVIFVATDLSARSELALRRAAIIARAKGWRMTIAHAIDDDQPEAVVFAHRRAAEAALADAAARLGDAPPCETRVILGDPAESLAAAADAAGAALTVLGPHRRSAIRDIFSGTTGERVIRATATPVLTVRREPLAPYRRMLLAVDCSTASRAALKAARNLALVAPRDVIAFHAADAPDEMMMRRGGASRTEIDAARHEAEREGKARLAAFLPHAGFPCQQVTTVNSDQTIEGAIHSTAERRDCDLIAIGTEGRSGVSAFFLGSVARKVLAQASADVLVAPSRSV